LNNIIIDFILRNALCNEFTAFKMGQQDEAICRCGTWHVSVEFQATKQWEKFIPYVTQCPLIPVFRPPYKEVVLSDETMLRLLGDQFAGLRVGDSAACLKCEAMDNASPLRKCARCGIARYYSKEC